MKMNWKAGWAWFSGFAMGPIGVYSPYFTTIFAKGWAAVPAEAHAAALTLALGGLGLIQMRRPQDHQSD